MVNLRVKDSINFYQKINTRNKVFYDLGSGKGNVVKYAAEDFPKLKKCKGVELHDDRHNEAVANVEGHQNQNKR